jgi:WD40 repeat protein/uncharacterized caspase-like protein
MRFAVGSLLFLGVFLAQHDTATAQTQSPAAPIVIHNSGHSNSIETIAFSPDDRWIASGSDDSTIKLWDRSSGRLLRTLTGHSKKVTWLAITPDARLVVSLSEDATAKVWEAATGRLIRSITGLKSANNDVLQDKGALSADGKSLFSTSYDAIRRVDLSSGALLKSFAKPDTSTRWQTFAVSPDEHLIAAAQNAPAKYSSMGSQVELLDAATGRVVRVLGIHDKRESVTSIAFSPDGRLVASGGYDGIGRVWEVASGRLLFTLAHSDDPRGRFLNEIRFSKDAKIIVTLGGEDGIKLWDGASGKLVRQLKEKPFQWSVTAAYSVSGDAVASASGKTITLADAANWAVLPVSFGQGEAYPVSISTLPDGAWLAAGPSGLTIWKSKTAQLAQRLTSEPLYVSGPNQYQGLEAGGRTLVLNTRGGTKLTVRDAASGSVVRALEWGPTPKPDKPCPTCSEYSVQAYVISPDARYVAAALYGDPTTIKMWDLASGQLKYNLPALGYRTDSPGPGAYQLAFSADSRSLIAESLDAQIKYTIRVFDVESGKQITSFHMPETRDVGEAKGGSLAPSPDGRWIAVGYHFYSKTFDPYETSALLDARTGQLVRAFKANNIANYPTVVRFLPDGKSLLVGTSEGNKVNQWETETGRLIRSFEGSPGSPQSIALSADNRRLIVGNSNGTSAVWDIETGNRLIVSLQTASGEWVTITPEGFFSASAKGAELLHVVQGFTATGIDQVYQSLYRPDLVREKLAGDPRGLVREAAARLDLGKVIASGTAPDVRLTLPARGLGATDTIVSAEAEITDRGGGIGRIEWRVNGITAGIDNPAQSTGGQPLRLTRSLSLDAGDNSIEVVAYNGANLIASVPGHVSVAALTPAPAPTPAPSPGPSTTTAPAPAPVAAAARLFVLAAGSDNYADKRFRLQYSVADAKATAQALEDSGKGLYASVEARVMSDAEVVTDRLDAVFQDMSKKIQPTDVFVLYLAGHGKTVDGRYYFVPQNFKVDGEATSAVIDAAVKAQGISQEQWQRWFALIPARKSVILFDTCESGTLTGESETKTLERGAANDRLAQATGRSIITASSGSTEAFEGYHGHGLFTYNLLDALDKGDGDNNGTIEVTELAAFVYSQVIAISEKVFKQRQEPQMKITLNYPLTKQAHVLQDERAPVAMDVRPTYQLAQTASLQIKPSSGATVVRSLSPKTAVTVLKSEGGWSLIASEGKPLGYVATRDLAPMQ